MNVVQKAWMAGVIETRGKVRFTNNPDRKTNQLVLQVRTGHTAVATRLCELTGIRVDIKENKSIRVADRRPCAEHCQEAHSHVIAEIPEHAVWAISGAGAAIVLDNLVPFFVTTDGLQVVADNILARLPQAGRGRSAVDQTILRLKRLGWRIPDAAMEHFVGTPIVRRSDGRFAKVAEIISVPA
jgi:hypothetical protein